MAEATSADATLPSADGAEVAAAAEDSSIKKEMECDGDGDGEGDEYSDEAVEALQSQYEVFGDDDKEGAPAATEGEEGEEVVVRSEVAAAAPEEAAMAAEQKTEAAGGAERQVESSSAAATSTAASAAAACEEREEEVVERKAAMAAEHETKPIPEARLHELEAAAMWADAEDAAKQFSASCWPGLDGVYWRLAHKIACKGRIITCNTKAIPAGEIIVGSIFVHVTTPQVSARTPHASLFNIFIFSFHYVSSASAGLESALATLDPFLLCASGRSSVVRSACTLTLPVCSPPTTSSCPFGAHAERCLTLYSPLFDTDRVMSGT